MFPDRVAIDKDQIRRKGLSEFVKRSWSLVDSSALVWSPVLQILCEQLEIFLKSEESLDLVVNIPPGFGKSLIFSVFFPAWAWIIQDDLRFITASYSTTLSNRDSRRHRALVGSEWYRERWPGVGLDRSDTTAIGHWYNGQGGWRFSTTVRGAVCGQHCDLAIIDDQIDPAGANAVSGVELESVTEWYKTTLTTRFRDQTKRKRVLIMQRLHEQDLAGYMLDNGAVSLCFPMEFDPEHKLVNELDWRETPGELLDEKRFPREAVETLKKTLGPEQWDAQEQQNPSLKVGGVFHRDWLQKTWSELPNGGVWALSVDCKFTDKATSSLVAIHVWWSDTVNFWLIDRVAEHLSFTGTLTQISQMLTKWPQITAKLIEGKANGPAVMDVFKGLVTGIISVNPEGDKVSRANALTPMFQGGNVYFPDEKANIRDANNNPIDYSWVPQVKEFFRTFPKNKYKDDVDAATQAIDYFGNSYLAQLNKRFGKGK